MPPRRLIRRQPLADRIKAYLDPLDFMLWLSEQFDSEDWDQWQKDWATPIGLGLNFIMLIARANSGRGRRVVDDVFGDEPSGTEWLAWFVRSCTAHSLVQCIFIVNMRAGGLHRTSSLVNFHSECGLHLPSQTALSTIREQCGGTTKYAFRSPCTGRLITGIFITSALPV